MFDPFYEEIVTNTYELVAFMVKHVFIELVIPLSIFVGVMLIMFIDWSWIPISSFDRERGPSLEKLKKDLLE